MSQKRANERSGERAGREWPGMKSRTDRSGSILDRIVSFWNGAAATETEQFTLGCGVEEDQTATVKKKKKRKKDGA